MDRFPLGAAHTSVNLLAALFLIGAATLDLSDKPDLERYEFSELHMGMEVRLIMYARSELLAEKASQAAFACIEQLNTVFSHYEPESELSQLNRKAGGGPMVVSDALFTVLEYAVALSEESGGAFDVTVGPLVDLWRSSGERGMLPEEDVLNAAQNRVGWEHIRLDSQKQTVNLLRSDMELDLGGIAKGYILDETLAVLSNFGIERALVQAGGDIVVSQAPPDQKGWRVVLPYYPTVDSTHTITVTKSAVSTSGDTEQAVVIDGVRYSHVIDPRTGLGLTNQLMSTVVAPEGMLADGLSTAVSILGHEPGTGLLKRYDDVTAYLRPSPWMSQAQ